MDKSRVLLVILGYPSGQMREKAHFECIESLSGLGLDSMLISKCPASIELQKSFNYFIYSSNQEPLHRDLSPNYYLITDLFRLYLSNQKHTASLLDSIRIGISSSRILGYEFAVFVNYDVLFSEIDSNKLYSTIEETIRESKKGFFFTGGTDFYFNQKYNSEGRVSFLNWYETVIFGVNIDFFENKFNLPTTAKEFSQMFERGEFSPDIHFMCETIFYQSFKIYENDLKIIKQKTQDFFSGSTIDRIRTGMPALGIVKNYNNPDFPVAFFSCDLRNDEDKSYLPKFGPKTFIVRKNGEIFTKNKLNPGCWCYSILSKNDKDVSLECYSEEDELEFYRHYDLLDREDGFYDEGDITFSS